MSVGFSHIVLVRHVRGVWHTGFVWVRACQARGCSASTAQDPEKGPLAKYRQLVKEGSLIEDPHQVRTLHLLQKLHEELAGYTRPKTSLDEPSGLFSRLFTRFGHAKPMAAAKITKAPKGIYMHGGVGTGKTMVMDLFYQESTVQRKRRVHFNDFMLDVHDRMHKVRGSGLTGNDMMTEVINQVLREGWLLCFDEFQVTDIADALIMKQLFSGLWSRGCVMVATSNRPPERLYYNGLQRQLFLPFVDMLKKRSLVHSLEDSLTDYRLIKGAHAVEDVYLSPMDEANTKRFDDLWVRLANNARVVKINLRAQGRAVPIPQMVIGSRMARFSFQEICGAARGTGDYAAIAKSLHTVFISHVPRFGMEHINQVRRFITLVDTLYERNVKVVCLAQEKPQELFQPGGDRSALPDEVFAFDRTVSRLMEMQGQDYLKRCWRAEGPEFLVQFETEEITDEVLMEVWQRYDVDGNDRLDREELYAIMSDLCMAKSKHRNVPMAALDMTFKVMDRNGRGYIDRETFVQFGKRYGMDIWWGGGDGGPVQTNADPAAQPAAQ